MRSTGEPPVAASAPVLSAQALWLHALGMGVSRRAGWGGLVGRRQAIVLAGACAAAIDELVETGMWLEHDLGYVIPAVWVSSHPGRAVARKPIRLHAVSDIPRPRRSRGSRHA